MKQDILYIVRDFRDFLKTFLLKNKSEYILFACLLIFYLPYSLYIAYTSSIIDHPTIEADLYYSFDNPMILKYGRTQLTGHPLIYLFYAPFVYLGDILVGILGMKAKTILFLLISSSLVSASCVYIRRYLIEIVELNNKLSLLITLFYAFFSINLVLAFTPESFTLATFFLSFSIYYYSAHIKNNTQPTLLSSAVLGVVCLGGVTLTNISKGVIPILFLKGKNREERFHRFADICLLFLLILIVYQFWFFETQGEKDYFRSFFIHQEEFTAGFIDNSHYLKSLFQKFWGEPMLMTAPKEYITESISARASDEHMIGGTVYTSVWGWVYISILLVSIIASFVMNIKNRFVLLILALFSVDIVIHCVFKFGLAWPFMYGAHWVYCVPLLLGWLAKRLNRKLLACFAILLVVMFATLVVSNLYHIYSFTILATEVFP